MIGIALMLIGRRAFRSRWWVPALVGCALILISLTIVADLTDGASWLATRIFGLVLVVQGLVELAGIARGAPRTVMLLRAAKAALPLTLGTAILYVPAASYGVLSSIIAAALALDGLSRLATVALVRFRRWYDAVATSIVELTLALLLVADWPLPPHLDIPLLISLLLAMIGVHIARFAFLLRRGQDHVSIHASPLFGLRDWHGHMAAAATPVSVAPAPSVPLRLLVWTPYGAVGVAARRPIIDRYLGTRDGEGRLSTGHSALEMGDDFYLSHWPAEEIDQRARPILHAFSAGSRNDIDGLFLPSYAAECADWVPADKEIRFTRFSERRLRAYWAGYRRSSTYNITDRNCSIAVAGALEAALEGALSCDYPWQKLAVLMLCPSFWQAVYLRSRAEHLCWTPGLLLDYAAALADLTEPSRAEWPLRLLDRLHGGAAIRWPGDQPRRGEAKSEVSSLRHRRFVFTGKRQPLFFGLGETGGGLAALLGLLRRLCR